MNSPRFVCFFLASPIYARPIVLIPQYPARNFPARHRGEVCLARAPHAADLARRARLQSAHKQTPAQAAGLTDYAWTLDELLSATIQACMTGVRRKSLHMWQLESDNFLKDF